MLLALLLLISSATANPQIDCFVDQQECDIRPDNLIQTFLGITSIEECKALCEDEADCTAFTHFGSDNLSLQDGCLLFSACEERRACENCTLGTSQTECTCSISYHGPATADNFVNLVPGVKDEFACKRLCLNESRCDLYTYYGSGDPVQPETCFLLTGVLQQGTSVSPCESCHTGPWQCKVNTNCQAAVLRTINGSASNVIFAEESSIVTLVANEKDCYVDLDVIAIGGGGHGARGAGAGSGYVETGRISLLINNPAMEVTVGSSQAPSKVEVGGEVLVEAPPGQTNVTCGTACGADGYSGGGGYGGDRYGWGGGGGSNGSDGKDSSDQKGGKGSGLDVGLLSSEKFSLVPGEGGVSYGHTGRHGGGGGGVVVNGRKPGEVGGGRGEGFGGGGGYDSDEHSTSGFPGCVIIEMKSFDFPVICLPSSRV